MSDTKRNQDALELIAAAGLPEDQYDAVLAGLGHEIDHEERKP